MIKYLMIILRHKKRLLVTQKKSNFGFYVLSLTEGRYQNHNLFSINFVWLVYVLTCQKCPFCRRHVKGRHRKGIFIDKIPIDINLNAGNTADHYVEERESCQFGARGFVDWAFRENV